MKILLITDTHGKLAVINEIAHDNGVDAVIHAGDFGFYDNASVGRLSARELKLHIVHSNIKSEEKQQILGEDLEVQQRYVAEKLPLSDLQHYLEGELKFNVPVYAVWGNHEDVEVVKKFHTGEYKVDNLNLLHGSVSYYLGKLHLFGLGGNVLVGKKFFQRPIAGGGGRVWSTLPQYLRLLDTVRSAARDDELDYL